MDIMDYVPYTGFMQNDEETIAIMTKAATIVPKACDILGISLSDSESDDDTADTTDDSSPAQPSPPPPPTNEQVQQAKPKARAGNWASLEKTGASPTAESINHDGSDDRAGCSSDDDGTPASPTQFAANDGPKTTTTTTASAITTPDQIRMKRKRCASTPSSLGQSSSSSTAGFANEFADDDDTSSSSSSSTSSCSSTSYAAAAAAAGREAGGNVVIPPKRRRFPSISLPPTSAISQSNMSEHEANIRRKMLEDLEVFNTQIKQLAVIEKTKNRLLEKMLIISSALKNQGRAASPTATSAANSHHEDNQ